MARRDECGEVQATKRLRIPVTTWRWARHAGLVPEPDVSSLAWSRAAVEALDAGAVRASMPREPVSSYEAANRLATALGTPNERGQVPVVSAYLVERLIALGLLLDLSHGHKYPKLDPDQIDEIATRPGLPETRSSGPEQVAARLGVRRVDFEGMRRLGCIKAVSYGRVRFGAPKAGAVTVPRFATGDIDALLQQRPEVDWTHLRNIGKGRRSPPW
ncbi:hypothetical protein [Streptomyces albireticuli]|uniref:hypothetical protein n=1 Tax=Streptomyces albireticuli TaxID=1940 RepID=UPI0036B8975B